MFVPSIYRCSSSRVLISISFDIKHITQLGWRIRVLASNLVCIMNSRSSFNQEQSFGMMINIMRRVNRTCEASNCLLVSFDTTKIVWCNNVMMCLDDVIITLNLPPRRFIECNQFLDFLSPLHEVGFNDFNQLNIECH